MRLQIQIGDIPVALTTDQAEALVNLLADASGVIDEYVGHNKGDVGTSSNAYRAVVRPYKLTAAKFTPIDDTMFAALVLKTKLLDEQPKE